MPISEDELDHKTSAQHHHQAYHTHHNMQIPHQQVSGMSKAEQRRSNKPIMEKRRRARINHCLNELKTLILDAMKKDPARHSKLEKADILEMTVKHLQNVQRQQLAVAVATDPTVLHKFRTGFNECAGEVSRYIGRIEGVDPTVRSRLLAHLASCVSGLHQLTPFSFGAMAAAATPPPPPPQLAFPHLGAPSAASVPSPADEGGGVLPGAPHPSASAGIPRSVPYSTGDVNNNQRQNAASGAMTGLQLIPGRMPPGELTLLLPGNSLLTSEGDHKNFTSSALTPSAPPPSQPPSSGGGPSPSSSGSSPGHPAHQSAFTAVARATSPAPPSAVNLAPGPPSPASSTSSSCASTSCDSASFQNSSPASSTAPTLLQQQPSSEATKFSFRFPCAAIPTAPLGGSREARSFPFPPPASLMHARVPPFVVEPRSCAKEREEVGMCRVPAPIETPLESSERSVSEFSSSPLIYSVCPTAASSSSSASAPSSLLPDAILPRPPALLIPPSIPRDVLDFSVKRDRATMEESDAEAANRSPDSPRGVERSNSIELTFPLRGEEAMLPLAKMARLEVKVESTSRNDEDKTEAKESSEGRLSAKQVTTATDGSSSICNSANAACEDGAGCLDMWRPW